MNKLPHLSINTEKWLEFLEKRGKPWFTVSIAVAIIACWVLVAFSPHDVILIGVTLLCTVLGILAILRVLRGSLGAYNNREDDTDEEPVPSNRVKQALAKSSKTDFNNEKLLWESREHPISLWMWFAGAAALQIVAGFAFTVSGPGALVLWVGGMLVLGGRILAWHVHRICVTDKRLLVVSGIFSIEYKTMPLSKLTDQTASFPAISNILAWLRIIKTQYATLIVESAGQDQALSKVFYVPEAHKVNRLVMGMVL